MFKKKLYIRPHVKEKTLFNKPNDFSTYKLLQY
jgi:hypothetical protein